MEKITLKPNIKELIYKNGEDNVHFDVLSYQGVNGQEKMLGSFFVLGHIKYAEEDLAYAVSLISSLAKREYYSERSFQEQNAKSSFERTLKKLNEVLEDFFQNKNFKLDIGLAAISGDNIYISRLGKFKIAMARNGKYIDILNNIDLFSKDAEGEKQFSNIISGKIQPNDKIFAYFPFRSITSREKLLNNIFVKENQDEFGQKIAHLAANATNFSCCGVHIDMHEIKEIPVMAATYAKPILSVKARNDISENLPVAETKIKLSAMAPIPVEASVDTDIKASDETDEQQQKTDLMTEQPRIIPAEFSISRRANIFTPLASSFKKIFSVGRSGNRARQRNFIIISAIVIVPIIIFVLLKTSGGSSADKNALKQAGDNLKLAQSRIAQSNLKDARSLLQASLISLAGLSNKKAENAKQQINQTLKGIDHTSDKQPALFTDPMIKNKDFKASLIAVSGNNVSAADTDGNVFSVSQNDISKLNQFKTVPQFIFNTSSVISIFNNSDIFDVYDMKSKKSASFSLKDPTTAVDAVLYESNLYTLSGNAIYKYADAATGGVKRTDWANDSANGNLISLTSDGNIYALNSDGKLIKYFKGKKVSDFDLQLVPSSGSRIFTFKDSAFIYLADKTNKKVYVFDKTNGSLNTTFKLDAAGTPQDISISSDGTIWILSSDNKVWTIK